LGRKLPALKFERKNPDPNSKNGWTDSPTLPRSPVLLARPRRRVAKGSGLARGAQGSAAR